MSNINLGKDKKKRKETTEEKKKHHITGTRVPHAFQSRKRKRKRKKSDGRERRAAIFVSGVSKCSWPRLREEKVGQTITNKHEKNAFLHHHHHHHPSSHFSR
jgi:hypothetical protein